MAIRLLAKGVEAFAQALKTEHAIWMIAAAYLSGSIPFGFLLAHFFAKEDIRKSGSGNIGATNVARVLGKKLGVVTLVLDALKGAVPVAVALFVVFDDATHRMLLGSMVACAAFLGHCFPVWLKFRGGKGVATGLGVLAVYVPMIAAVGIFVFGLVFAFTRMVSASALCAGATLVGVVLWLQPFDVALVPLSLMFVVMVARHRGNMARILRKEESKL